MFHNSVCLTNLAKFNLIQNRTRRQRKQRDPSSKCYDNCVCNCQISLYHQEHTFSIRRSTQEYHSKEDNSKQKSVGGFRSFQGNTNQQKSRFPVSKVHWFHGECRLMELHRWNCILLCHTIGHDCRWCRHGWDPRLQDDCRFATKNMCEVSWKYPSLMS